jgi:SP family sugar:H+ symporter-like MFS transporter
VLTRLYGAAAARLKLAEIGASLAQDHHRPQLSDLINKATGKIRPIVWIGVGLATFQQLVGINVVFYYGAVLWQAVGFSESDALLINVLSGALSIGACLVTVLLIDRIGRKPLLWIGSVGMAVSLALLTFAFASASLDAAASSRCLPAMGDAGAGRGERLRDLLQPVVGPVMWVMLGEMFPNQIRGSGPGRGRRRAVDSNFAITVTFPILLAAFGLAGAYGIYTAARRSRCSSCNATCTRRAARKLEQMES